MQKYSGLSIRVCFLGEIERRSKRRVTYRPPGSRRKVCAFERFFARGFVSGSFLFIRLYYALLLGILIEVSVRVCRSFFFKFV